MISWTYLVIVLALLLYFGTGIYAGYVRGRTGLKAPAVTGNERFERAYRVQMNTLEQLVPFLPALWLFSSLLNPMVGAILGAVWIAGRALYWYAYMNDPARRGPGFMIAAVPLLILLLGALVGTVRAIGAGA